jgi:hypothetical protein
MLNLALMTLSASSLERRIGVMQGRQSLPAAAGVAAGFAAGVLLTAACSTTTPGSVGTEAAPQSPAARGELPSARDAQVSPDTMVQRAATRTYGDQLPATAGRPARLWFTFNPDWSVREHGEGPEGLVEAEGWRSDPHWAKSKGPVYTVRESVEKRFGITINDSRVVSHYGGSRAVLGGDTAWVFYARFAQ